MVRNFIDSIIFSVVAIGFWRCALKVLHRSAYLSVKIIKIQKLILIITQRPNLGFIYKVLLKVSK